MPAGMVRPRASQAPRAAEMPPAPAGVWLLATAALGRRVSVDEVPLPHVCGSIVAGGTREVKLWRRDCAACSWEAEQERRGGDGAGGGRGGACGGRPG